LEPEDSFEGESPLDEVGEMGLAAELLEVTDEAELDQFLGKLLKKATSAVGRGLHSSLGGTLGSYLKGAIKKALPIAGGALGNFLAPGVGGAIGTRLASNAGQLFGLELEGLSAEDGEYEIARRLVRFGAAAARQASDMAADLARSRAGAGQLAQTARDAVLSAARQHAPGFIRAGADLIRGQGSSAASPCRCGTHRHRKHESGSWIRHGREIHLLGA
jgi:uncharacterized protein (DUF697 family)